MSGCQTVPILTFARLREGVLFHNFVSIRYAERSVDSATATPRKAQRSAHKMRWEDAHHTHPDIAGTVVRKVAETVRRTTVTRIIVPRPAAQGASVPTLVYVNNVKIVVFVETPFPDVAAQIVKVCGRLFTLWEKTYGRCLT